MTIPALVPGNVTLQLYPVQTTLQLQIASGGKGPKGDTGDYAEVGESTIASGVNTRVLYNNNGTLGEYAVSGTGSVAMTDSPSFMTPDLGTPSAADLTNAIGLPVDTGISGLGSGISTYLAKDITFVTPQMFDSPMNGVDDDYPTFNGLIKPYLALNPSKRLLIDGPFRLDSNYGANATDVIHFGAGTVKSGSGYFVFGAQVWNSATRNGIQVVRGPGTQSTVGVFDDVTNTGAAGYGRRLNFEQQGAATSGFSIGDGVLGNFQGVNGGQGLASWLVAATPYGVDTNTWGVFGQEVNPINRGPDEGYYNRRGLSSRWTGGIQIVPESTDLIGGNGYIGNHTLFGFLVSRSGNLNTNTSDYAKTYNGFLVEPEAIAPGGCALMMHGAATTGKKANYILEALAIWDRGIDISAAVFASNAALRLGNTHQIVALTAGAADVQIGGLDASDNNILYGAKARIASTGHLWLSNATAGTGAYFYNTVDNALSPTNYERGYARWASNAFVIGTEAGGTGSSRTVVFTVGGTQRWWLSLSGHLLTIADNTCDIGGVSANRPKNIHAGTNIYAGGEFFSGANKVVGARKTGWSAATGTATRTAFDTASVTTAQLAERVKALIDDLHATSGHGLISA